MNNYLVTNVQIEDIYIEEDKKRSQRYSRYTVSNTNKTSSSNLSLEETKTCKICAKTKHKDEF